MNTIFDRAIKLEKASWGLKPKNSLNRLLRAESLYRSIGADEQAQQLQRAIQARKNQIGDKS